MLQKKKMFIPLVIAGLGFSLIAPITAEAHCDTPSGPTYDALQTAIEKMTLITYRTGFFPKAKQN